MVRNLNEREGLGKTTTFGDQKVYKIIAKKDEDGLVFVVQEESNPHTRVRFLHYNNLLSCQEFKASYHQVES